MSITHDSEFTIADLEQSIASDLANDLGNLLNRMTTLAIKNNVTTIAVPKVLSASAQELHDACIFMMQEYEKELHDGMFHRAVAALWKYVQAVNAYFHGAEPWKLARQDQEAFLQVLSATCHSLRAIGVLLSCVMPHKMKELLASIGVTQDATLYAKLDEWNYTFMLQQIPPLFKKPEPQKDKESSVSQEIKPETSNYIDISHFAAVELRVGQIATCEQVEKSEKLLKLTVDFGEHGMRQIFAGVKKFFAPEDLIGKKAVFVFNLKPRKMMGMESQGMMLMAEKSDGSLSYVSVDDQVTPGAQLR
jgi:methionyl-tRNA synthetase